MTLSQQARPTGIAVVGSGYVGAVVAAALASFGHQVIGIDSNPARVASLADGIAPFHEPGLDDLIRKGIAAGNLRFSQDLAIAVSQSDIIFLCVGTPTGREGRPDLDAIEQVAESIGEAISGDRIIVTKSTVPIGTNEWIQTTVTHAARARGVQAVVSIVSNPEFLRVGSAVDDFFAPDRIVVGSDDAAARDVVVALYEPILAADETHPALIATGLTTAETVKYAANAFLAMKVSFINEISQIADRVGADIAEVAHALGTDSRISPLYLQAGLGWGGSCFGKDLAALATTAREQGYEPALLQAVASVNDHQRDQVVRRLQARLGVLRGKRIALLGLAFKPGTDDTRDSTSGHIARRLRRLGASVVAHDPVVARLDEIPDLKLAPDPYAAVAEAEAVVIVTDWPEYATLDLDRISTAMAGSLLLDGRNLLDPAAATAAGFDYEGIGRSAALQAPMDQKAPRVQ